MRAASSLVVIVVLGLTGCARIFGVTEVPVAIDGGAIDDAGDTGGTVTVRATHHRTMNDLSGTFATSTSGFGADSIPVTVDYVDGAQRPVMALDDGSFTFPQRTSAYMVQLPTDAQGPYLIVGTSLNVVFTEVEFGFGSGAGDTAHAGTIVGTAANGWKPAAGEVAEYVTTGIADTAPLSNTTFSVDLSAPFVDHVADPPLGIPNIGVGDRAYILVAAPVNAHLEITGQWSIAPVDAMTVTTSDPLGPPTAIGCTTVSATHEADTVAFAQAMVANGGTPSSTTGSWQVWSTPDPLAPLDGWAASAGNGTDAQSTNVQVMLAGPFPNLGWTVENVIDSARTLANPEGTATVTFRQQLRAGDVAPVGLCSGALGTVGAGVVGVGGQPSIDSVVLGDADWTQTVSDSPREITWPVTGAWDTAELAIETLALTTNGLELTRQITVLVANTTGDGTAHFPMPPKVFGADDYILHLRLKSGVPNAAAGDFATRTRPTGESNLFSHAFHASHIRSTADAGPL